MLEPVGFDDQPGVTVIIPVHHAGTTLRASVESALSQRRIDMSVVIALHGSDTETREVAMSFEHLQDVTTIDVPKSATDRTTPAYPLNEALRVLSEASSFGSTASWIFRLDADDFYANELAIRNCLDAGGRKPWISGLCVPFNPVTRDAYVLGPREEYRTVDALRQRGGTYTLAHASNAMREDLILRLLQITCTPFDENVDFGEDLVLSSQLLRLTKEIDFRFVEQVLYYKAVRETSLTSSLSTYGNLRSHYFLSRLCPELRFRQLAVGVLELWLQRFMSERRARCFVDQYVSYNGYLRDYEYDEVQLRLIELNHPLAH